MLSVAVVIVTSLLGITFLYHKLVLCRLTPYGSPTTSPKTRAFTLSLPPICAVPFRILSLYVSLRMNKSTIGWSTVDPSKLCPGPRDSRNSTTPAKKLVGVPKAWPISSNRWFPSRLINPVITLWKRLSPNIGGCIVVSSLMHLPLTR